MDPKATVCAQPQTEKLTTVRFSRCFTQLRSLFVFATTLLPLGSAIAQAQNDHDPCCSATEPRRDIWDEMKAKRTGGTTGTFKSEEQRRAAFLKNETVHTAAQQRSQQELLDLKRETEERLAADARAVEAQQKAAMQAAVRRAEERKTRAQATFDERVKGLRGRMRGSSKEDSAVQTPSNKARAPESADGDSANSTESQDTAFPNAETDTVPDAVDSTPSRGPASLGTAAKVIGGVLTVIEGAEQVGGCAQGLIDKDPAPWSEPGRRGCYELGKPPLPATKIPFGGYRDESGNPVSHDRFYGSSPNSDPNFVGPPAPSHRRGLPVEIPQRVDTPQKAPIRVIPLGKPIDGKGNQS
jgi:hypothetical protein